MSQCLTQKFLINLKLFRELLSRFACHDARIGYVVHGHSLYGPRREETCLRGFANNTGADQPAHPRRLISAFVIRLSRSIISRLATSEISIFWLISEAEETGLKLALSETPKTGFLLIL